MVTIKCDLVLDEMDISPEGLKDGQDITLKMAHFNPRPWKATIIEAEGPAGGNPFVKLQFHDEDLAWDFFSNYVSEDYDDFESAMG